MDGAALDCCGAGKSVIYAGQGQGAGSLFIEVAASVEFIAGDGFVGGEVKDEVIAVDVGLAAEVGGAAGAIVLDGAALDCCGAGEAVVCAGEGQCAGSLFIEVAASVEFII